MKNNRKIWIDLDNSPHVPFFRPIIDELRKNKFEVVITLRQNAQTIELADMYGFTYKNIGKHYGKNKLLKVIGTFIRSAEFLPFVLKERPSMAVSHGSRSMLLTARLLRIPSIHIGDYEHTKELCSPDWYVIPSIIPKSAIHLPPDRVHTYPGIKEDVYAPTFHPDASVFKDLNIPQDKIIAVIRPPAVEAHYHNPESEKLFEAAIEHLSKSEDTVLIVIPRYAKQGHEIKSVYKNLVEKGKMIIPHKVYDGLNIIWLSDFVVSGGGTMNREAAALNVPVYSIFRGTIGAVDRYLSENGRLILLESVDDVKNKIKVEKRARSSGPHTADNSSLNAIVGIILKMWDEWYGG